MKRPTTEEKTTHDSIGEFLTIDANTGETIRVVCEDGEFTGKIIETPNDVPTEAHQQFEVTVGDDTKKDSYGGIIGIQINSMDSWGMECYCYGLQFIDDSYDIEEIGDVQKILILD